MAILFESLYFNVFAIFLSVFALLCLYVSRNFNFWKNQGVPYVKPLPLFGSLKDVTLQRLGIGFYLKEIYEKYKGKPYVGIFSFDQPAVVVRDLEIVKNVLVKDGDVFVDRTIAMDEDLDPLGARNLFVMRGQKWKHMRGTLSPTFTSGKMKTMFHLVDKCAKELLNYLDVEVAKDPTLQVKTATSKFTVDVIASCAFGIDSNSLKDDNAEFTVQLQKVFVFSARKAFASVVAFFSPKLLKFLRLSIIDDSVNKFVRNTVWNTVDYREKHGVVRGDFLDNMIQLRRKGMESSPTDKSSVYKIDGDDFVAQALTFLTAGFETSSSTISFALYELSLQPELQQRLRDEITEVLAKYKQEVTYEGMQEMKYLDMVVSETLRKYPILPFLDRKCHSDYELPAPNGKGTIPIQAGTGVYIPLIAIHYDPEYFPEPLRFDPERFTEENKQNRPNYSYMPFGEGPRFCIGMRFGLMQTKTGLIHILSNYQVEPTKDTQVPLVFDMKSFLLSPEKGIPLSFKKVNKT